MKIMKNGQKPERQRFPLPESVLVNPQNGHLHVPICLYYDDPELYYKINDPEPKNILKDNGEPLVTE